MKGKWQWRLFIIVFALLVLWAVVACSFDQTTSIEIGCKKEPPLTCESSRE